jgi:hypothetical protein
MPSEDDYQMNPEEIELVKESDELRRERDALLEARKDQMKYLEEKITDMMKNQRNKEIPEELKNSNQDLSVEHLENIKKLTEAISLGSVTTALAMKKLSLVMQRDPEYAYSWHCNIACAAIDEGIEHSVANRIASNFMSNAFKVTTYYNMLIDKNK